MRNKTPDDAINRVLQARMGFGVDASDVFLISLEVELYKWADTIRKMLNLRTQQYELECKRREIETIECERAGECAEHNFNG